MKFYDVPQRSDEWYRLKRGVPSASQAYRIITPKTWKESAYAGDYRGELVAERILGAAGSRPVFATDAMKNGIAREPYAIKEFMAKTGLKVLPGGWATDDKGLYGCSPDGFIEGRNEGIEVKCPEVWTQCKYLVDGPDDKYVPQMQTQCLICGFDRVHFWSWYPDPNIPPVHRVYERNMTFIELFKPMLEHFCLSIDRGVAKIRRKLEGTANE